MDAATLNGHLNRHLRTATFPLGIRALAPGEAIPAKARRPARDLGARVTICQCVGLARRYGWTMAFSGEDLGCPPAKAAFGFEDRIPYYTEGTLADGMYASCRQAGAAFEEALPRLGRGEIQAVAVGPLERIAFEPETVVVYGNSAQALRLVNAALWREGGAFTAETTGRADCADMIIRTRQSGRPQLVLPCYGDRVFGSAGDDEMAFAFPFARADEIVAGLDGTWKGGVRYPIPAFALRAQPELPPSYVELERRWRAGEK